MPDTRSYDATVTQDGPRLTVTLSGADFIVIRGRGNAFSGFIDAGNRVTFAIGDPSDEYHYGPYDLVERIDDARALIVSGSVTAELSSTGISGTLSGAFLLSATVEPFVRVQQLLWDRAPVRDGSTVVVVMRRYNVGLKGFVRAGIVALVVAVDSRCGRIVVARIASTCQPPLGMVIITLDTTRADRLPVYGFMDAAMPHLDRLAREGVVFDQATSVAPLTLPAHCSLFTGLFPPPTAFGTMPIGRCRRNTRRSPRPCAHTGSAPERSSDRSCSMRIAVLHRASIRTGALSMPAYLSERWATATAARG